MSDTFSQVTTHIQSIILTLGFMVFLGIIVGYFASQKYGDNKKSRKFIFVAVGLPIILIGTIIAELMVRSSL